MGRAEVVPPLSKEVELSRDFNPLSMVITEGEESNSSHMLVHVASPEERHFELIEPTEKRMLGRRFSDMMVSLATLRRFKNREKTRGKAGKEVQLMRRCRRVLSMVVSSKGHLALIDLRNLKRDSQALSNCDSYFYKLFLFSIMGMVKSLLLPISRGIDDRRRDHRQPAGTSAFPGNCDRRYVQNDKI